MFPGNIGMTELLVILFIVLIIFGAGKLPEIGRGLGQAIRGFRKAASGEVDELTNSSKEKELPKDDSSKK
jgi:sec-independent protein translocase protein TatA